MAKPLVDELDRHIGLRLKKLRQQEEERVREMRRLVEELWRELSPMFEEEEEESAEE